MGTHIKYAFLGGLLIMVQVWLMRMLSVENITPDVLTIWVVYVALQQGQLRGMIWGFCVGLAFDLATGNFIGLSALSKTVCGFAAGFFYNENKAMLTLGSYRFVLIVLIVSFIHNMIYFTIFTQGSDIGFLRAVGESGLATTAYTATISLLPMMVFSRKLGH